MTEKRKLEDYIREKVAESGYPLEIEVSNTLESLGYAVHNTHYFQDPETKEGRSIDILATPFFESSIKFREIVPFESLAIECKKSNNYAWVFFTRPNEYNKGLSPSNLMSGQCKSSIPNNINPYGTSMDDWLILELYPNLHYASFERIAIAYHEVKNKSLDKSNKRSSTGRQEIFEAIIQLTKFVNYRIHGHLGLLNEKKKVSQELCCLMFPIVVFDGDLFEAKDQLGELVLERKNHVLLKTDYLCPYCRKIESYGMDIVHKSFVKEFINEINEDIKNLEIIISKHQDSIGIGAQKERDAKQKGFVFKSR